jgi:hypothetical protein
MLVRRVGREGDVSGVLRRVRRARGVRRWAPAARWDDSEAVHLPFTTPIRRVHVPGIACATVDEAQQDGHVRPLDRGAAVFPGKGSAGLLHHTDPAEPRSRKRSEPAET